MTGGAGLLKKVERQGKKSPPFSGGKGEER